MSKVLLVDTNFSSIPIYNKLLELGHDVHVVGGNPSDALAKICKNYWDINYSNVRALSELIHIQDFEFIVPGSTDRSYTSCVQVGNGKYPGIESENVDNALNNKVSFKKMAEKLMFSVPKDQTSQDKDKLIWPLIVKPADSFSGKGITVIKNKDFDKLEFAIELAKNNSNTKKYLIEDFIDGELHSHSAFLKNGMVHKDFFVEEYATVNPYVVNTSRIADLIEPSIVNELRSAIEKIANYLSLQDGLIHTQFLIKDRKAYLIETTRRCPGDLYSQLIEMSTGCAYVENYVKPFLGKELFFDTHVNKQSNLIIRHTITQDTSINLKYINFMFPIQIKRWVPLSLVGDKLNPSPEGRIAIAFFSAKSKVDFDKTFADILSHELYKINQ